MGKINTCAENRGNITSFGHAWELAALKTVSLALV